MNALGLANLRRRKGSGLLVPDPESFSWDYDTTGNTAAISINSGSGAYSLSDLNFRTTASTTGYAVVVNVTRDVTIENCRFDCTYRAFGMVGGTLTLRNCTFRMRNPDINGAVASFAVATGASQVDIENCTFYGGGGIRANPASMTVANFRYNNFVNQNGLKSNGTLAAGRAGYQTESTTDLSTHWLSHGIQILGASAPNGLIEWNKFTNQPSNQSDSSDPILSLCDDVINLDDSGGTAGNPFIIRHNLIDGCQSSRWWDHKTNGCGIILDANAGSGTKNIYVDIENNWLARCHHVSIEPYYDCQNINVDANKMAFSGSYNGTAAASAGPSLIYLHENGTYVVVTNNECWKVSGKDTVTSGSGWSGGTGNSLSGTVDNGVADLSDEDAIVTGWDAARVIAVVPSPGSSHSVWW